MQQDELLARLVAQQNLLPAGQVQQLFPAFQRAQVGSSDPERDFLTFLVDSKLVEPSAAGALRERLRQNLETRPLPPSSEAHTAPLNAAPAQTVLDPPSTRAARSSERLSASGSLVRPARRPGASGPRQIGPYDVIRELGRGGMGVVYEARHRTLDRHVALKMLRERDVFKLESIERFKVEARAMAKLEHPNIVRIYEIGEDAEGVYMAMAFAEGGALSARMRRERLQPREAATLVQQIARGLAHAHDNNIIHRDLKPDNILLSKEGRPRLTDFGLAKALDHDSVKLSRTGQVMGTLAYMAPEQLDSKTKNHDRRSDIYALGVTFYEMLTGRLPHLGEGQLDLAKKIMFQEPERPTSLCHQLPVSLETIVLRALVKEPNRRYQSAAELADDLERWLNNERIAARPVGVVERLQRWRRQRGRQAAKAALALVAALCLGLLVGRRGGPPQAAAAPPASEARELAAARDAQRAAEASLAEAQSREATAVEALDQALGGSQGRGLVEASEAAARALAEASEELAVARQRLEKARRPARLLLEVVDQSFGPQASPALVLFAQSYKGGSARGSGFKNLYFKDCQFRQASWEGLDLKGAHFEDCELLSGLVTGVDFSGIDLSGLGFGAEVRFEGCRYDAETRWDAGFDPEDRPGLKPVGPKPVGPKPAPARPVRDRAASLLRSQIEDVFASKLTAASAADARGKPAEARAALLKLTRGLTGLFEEQRSRARRGLRLSGERGEVYLELLKKHAEDLDLVIAAYKLADAIKPWGAEAFRAAIGALLEQAFYGAAKAVLKKRPAEAYRFVRAAKGQGFSSAGWWDLAFLVGDELGLQSLCSAFSPPTPALSPGDLKSLEPDRRAIIAELRQRANARRAAHRELDKALARLEQIHGPRLKAAFAEAKRVFETQFQQHLAAEQLVPAAAQQRKRGSLKCLEGVVKSSLGRGYQAKGGFPQPFQGSAAYETRRALERAEGMSQGSPPREMMLNYINRQSSLCGELYLMRFREVRSRATPADRFGRAMLALSAIAARLNGQEIDARTYKSLLQAVEDSEMVGGCLEVEESYLAALRKLAKDKVFVEGMANPRRIADRLESSWAAPCGEGRSLLKKRARGRVFPVTLRLSCAAHCRVTLKLGGETITLEGGAGGDVMTRELETALGRLTIKAEALAGRPKRQIDGPFKNGPSDYPGVRLLLTLADGTRLFPNPRRFEGLRKGEVVATEHKAPQSDPFSLAPALWAQVGPERFPRSWSARLEVGLADFRSHFLTELYQQGMRRWGGAPFRNYVDRLKNFLERSRD